MSHDRQLEKRRRQLIKTAYLAAVLAGCTISTASYAQTTKEWDGSSNGNYNTAANWTTSGVPGATDQAVFGSISTLQNDVTLPVDQTIDNITFSDGANAQSFELVINNTGDPNDGDLFVNGTNAFGGTALGIVNESGLTQQITLAQAGSKIHFNNSSTITNTGAGTVHISNLVANGAVNFNNTSSAGDAGVSITNANGGDTVFNDTSNAGSATITNNDGGETYFNEGSSAGSATIINNDGGETEFDSTSDTVFSTAGDANITNNTGGETHFHGYSTAGDARLINDGGSTSFDDNSNAGTAFIRNTNGGDTDFDDDSSAGDAVIINNGGHTDFADDASAGTAFIVNRDSGYTEFYGDSTAADAFIINGDGGYTEFENDSTAGNATIINRDGGRTIFDNSGDVNGATVVNLSGGELEIDDAVTIGHVRGAGNVILTSSLTLNSDNSSTPTRNDIISGVISGSGGLTKEGENIVRLSGDNTYTGDTVVNNGVLSLPGSITSNTTVNTGAELRGNGTITGNLTSVGGRIVTGDAFGGDTYSALNVNGNFSADTNSTFVSRVSSTGYDDYNNSLLATGTITLDGDVEVEVDQSPGSVYLVNNQFLLARGTGGRTGTFDGVDTGNSDIPYYLDLTNDIDSTNGLSYDSTSAYLNLRRNTLDDLVDGVNLTRNQRAAYDSLNSADFNNLDGYQEDVINEFIYDATDYSPGHAASLLSGDALTAFPVAAQGAANRFNQRLMSQVFNQAQGEEEYASLRTPRLVYSGNTYRTLLAQGDGAAAGEAASASTSRSSVWATIARAKEDTDSDGNGPGFDVRATEYQVGYNRKLSGNTVLGLSIGKSDADITVDDRAAKGDLDTTSFGAYIRHDNDDLYFSGLLSYSRHNIDSRRATNPYDTANADYDARTIALWGEVGKKMDRGSLAIEPHISLKLSNTKQDSFSESGFGGLDVNSEKYNTRRLGLGVRVATNSATARFRPYGFVGYEREFGDDQAELTNSVAGLSAFRVRGSELGKNIWALRLGTDARINDRFSVVGEIGASWRKNQDSRYIYGGVKYGW